MVGAGIGYYYEKNEAGKFSAQVAAIEAQLAQEMDKTKGAAAEIEALKAEVAAKAKEIEAHVAKITELESKPKDATEPAAQSESG